MKNVLLMVHDDAGQEARLQAALDLTRATKGHLTCLDVAILVQIAGDYDGAATAVLINDERTRESANRARLDLRLASEGVSWSWVESVGTLAACVRDAAHLADLIVINRRLEGLPLSDMRAAIDEIIVTSNKPVVAVPERTRGFDVAGKALIAWNGSAASNAALRAAVPLLTLAETVTLLAIDDRSQTGDMDEAAAYLSRHDIRPVVATAARGERSTAVALLREIAERRASYLVMGGYGHSRLREAIFGGVTRQMLESCPIPLILAH